MTAPTIRTLEDARWDCGGCTACCRHFDLGPVSDDIIAGLERRGVREAWSPAADGFAERRAGPDGLEAWFLTRRHDGACVFLQDDGGCAVHARWGAAAKPAFCREYPFTLVRDGDAVSVVVRADCGGWAASATSGTPLTDQVQAVMALPRLHPVNRFAPQAVEVLPGVGVAGEQWPLVEETLTEALPDDADPDHAVAALRDALTALMRREPPSPDPDRAARATAFAVERLREALGPAVARPPADDPSTRGMVAFLATVLDLAERASPRLGAPRPLSDEARAYTTLVIRSQLLGRAFQPLGGLPVWLGALALGTRVARAAVDGEGPVDARPFGHDLATFVRLTRHTAARRLLADLRPVLIDLAWSLPGA